MLMVVLMLVSINTIMNNTSTNNYDTHEHVNVIVNIETH